MLCQSTSTAFLYFFTPVGEDLVDLVLPRARHLGVDDHHPLDALQHVHHPVEVVGIDGAVGAELHDDLVAELAGVAVLLELVDARRELPALLGVDESPRSGADRVLERWSPRPASPSRPPR